MTPLKSLERLEPASFTIVMATGSFAIVCLDMSAFLSWLAPIAIFLNILNFAIFIFLVTFALVTWPFHKPEFRDDLNFPQKSAFYAAIGIALLVLSAQALRFNLGFAAAIVLWSLGCLFTLGITFALNFRFFVYSTPELKLFTPVFFIPTGGLVVIPVAGVALMTQLTGFPHDLLLMINALSLGGGLLLYLGIFSLILQRHYLAEHLPHKLVPTVWIHLAPIGWGGVSFANLADALGNLDGLGLMLSALLWGGCCWWLIMCVLLTLRAMSSGEMKFSLAYWAFIFPLGSITVLSFKLGRSFMPAFYVCWALMAFFWLVAFAQTFKNFTRAAARHCRANNSDC